MTWQTAQYKLTGEAPLIMHNGQTANPLNHFAKAMKQISSKRTKTEADYEELARIEFMAGLYMNGNGPMIPAENWTAMITKAAMKRKEGPIARPGMMVLKDADVEYEGPRDADELWDNESFRFSALVRIGQSRVARMRPIFHDWSTIVEVNYEDTLANRRQVDEWLDIAGGVIGMGDWRPRFGRFSVEVLD